jgi:phytoene dehydrogenase-like protein
LAGCAGLPLWTAAGCAPADAVNGIEGEFLGASEALGHALRDGALSFDEAAKPEELSVDVAIVGAGVAGLAAAWRLLRSGIDDYVILELEPRAGGTAASAARQGRAYPLGAHYLPLPMAHNRALLVLLEEMGLLEGFDARGQPLAREEHLCRDPQERVFDEGVWHEGLFPDWRATADDLRQLRAFQELIDGWIAWRDLHGKRVFTLPASASSDDAQPRALDHVSMKSWMDRHGLHSPLLHWWVDYACRDDYGLTIDQASAWAALHYFAARVEQPGQEPRPYLTWPEGNGRLVGHMAAMAAGRLRTSAAVAAMQPDRSGVLITANRGSNQWPLRVRARRAIFAAPQFLAPFIMPELPPERRAAAGQFRYGAWLTANLFLNDRPREQGFPLAWDNVLFHSRSLGYVVATHQRQRDYGPTILTWYLPLLDENPAAARHRLQLLRWSDCARLALDDLTVAHPDLRALVERIDVMKWGHAMIRPTPGFISGKARLLAAQPWRHIHFAHSDLSGLALFEEAFFHGLRAAEEVLASLGMRFETLLS